MRCLLRRLGHWVRAERHDQELREEIEAHRHMAQRALERRGVAPEQAVEISRRSMGNVRLAREDSRAAWDLDGRDARADFVTPNPPTVYDGRAHESVPEPRCRAE
jgi:hypothetical protein